MINLHFLHGFLGLPSDWEQFKHDFKAYTCFNYSIDDFLPSENILNSYFEEWAIKFNSSIFENENTKKNKNILIGYSLGGRLSLHCLTVKNSAWDAAIIISANPGLKNESDKASRLKNDMEWSKRFLTEEWEKVFNDWNSQGVFSNKKNTLKREESLFNREKISEILLKFSLSKQENLRDKLKKINLPVLWISGELDLKFSEITNEMSKLNPHIVPSIISEAGHRVPWENPNLFVDKCTQFFKENDYS